MKWTKLQLILAFMVSVLMINSCQDDPVNPGDDTASYFQFKTGNYWVYKIDSLDANQAIVVGTSSTDSTVDVGVEMKSGKSANKFANYYSDGSNDDGYFALDGKKLYSLIADVSSGGVSLPISGWVLISDFDAATWTVLDTSLPIQTNMGEINAKVTVVGSKGILKNITVGTSSISCQEFIQTISITAQVSGFTIPITLKIKYYFGKNVGLVQVSQETAKYTIPLLGDQYLFGFIRSLQRYKIS